MNRFDRQPVPAEAFVDAYLKSHEEGQTVAQLSRRLRMTKNAIRVRVYLLRQKNVMLPPLRQRRASVNYAALRVRVRRHMAKMRNAATTDLHYCA